MKKFILAALAASVALSPMAAAPALAAPQQHNDRGDHNVQQRKIVVKKVVKRAPARSYRSNWRKGERFDYHQARNYRQIDYRQHRNLKAPPRGYRYVQSGNDAVLVGITSGIIAAVIAGALN
jgi:Ni/Co efflux regulator RcnB